MLGFMAIFVAGLCGYAKVTLLAWPAAAIALSSFSWARRYILIQQRLDASLDAEVFEALARSFVNALVATGGCYWFGVGVRAVSGY